MGARATGVIAYRRMEVPALTTTASAELTVGDLNRRARQLLPEIAADSADRERERVLPYEQVRQVADAGLLTFRIPRSLGGPGASLAETAGFIVDLAAADANVAQSLRSAFLFAESLRATDSDAERSRWLPRVLAGDVFGNAGWERGGRNGEIRARIVSEGDRFRATGTKSYSTGALFADWVSTTALDEAGNPVSFTVPHDREGLRLLDDWDGMGQRLTASGTTELHNMIVYPEEIRHRSRRGYRSPVTAFAQLYLAAVLAGIGQAALHDAVAFARQHARPIVHAKARRSVDDPYVQHAVGEISARAFAGRAAVVTAAAAIDTALATPADETLATATAVAVAQAQFVAAETAMRCAELAFEVGGASATLREHNLDRHWRNARTVANHNPRAYKAGVVGAYHLTGEEPPTSGLF
jgi:alkylation response protein AidB-like acyl-CoA dehydrogenase